MRAIRYCLLVVVLASPLLTKAQNDASTVSPPGGDASSVLNQARTAFAPQGSPAQIILDGTAHFVAGSLVEAGTAHLVASTDGSYLVSLDLGGDKRTEQRALQNGDQSCTWSGLDGTVHEAPPQNCMLDAAWFLPGLSLLASSQVSSVYSVVGSIVQQGQDGIILRQHSDTTGMKHADLQAHLSTFDFILSQQTHLPLAADFSIHPDSNTNIDIPVEIVFSDYRVVDGVSLPYRIQRFVNGTLTLDITVSSASVQ